MIYLDTNKLILKDGSNEAKTKQYHSNKKQYLPERTSMMQMVGLSG